MITTLYKNKIGRAEAFEHSDRHIIIEFTSSKIDQYERKNVSMKCPTLVINLYWYATAVTIS